MIGNNLTLYTEVKGIYMRKEVELLILCSKSELSGKDINQLHQLINYNLDWGKFLYWAVHHRTVPIIVKNLKAQYAMQYVESHVRKAMEQITHCISMFNSAYLEEMLSICKEFDRKNVSYAVLKGAALASEVYSEPGLRQFGDIDFLINPSSVTDAENILKSLGYTQGRIDVNTEKIIKTTYKENVHHRLVSHELQDFYRLSGLDECPFYNIDINFSPMWKGTNQKRRSLCTADFLTNTVRTSVKTGEFSILSFPYQLIHLCGHLYSEAVFFPVHTNWCRDKSDLNLIKFCDIRELICQHSQVNWKTLFDLACSLGCEDALYYSLATLNEIYPDTVSPKFFSYFESGIPNLNAFYDSKGNEVIWRMPFMERMFDIEGKKEEYYGGLS